MKKITRFISVFLLTAILASSLFTPDQVAHAAAALSVTPITWNVIGLDSNDVNVGPNNFPVGVRVCNTGDATATNVNANFVFTSGTNSTYIFLRPGSLTSISQDRPHSGRLDQALEGLVACCASRRCFLFVQAWCTEYLANP